MSRLNIKCWAAALTLVFAGCHAKSAAPARPPRGATSRVASGPGKTPRSMEEFPTTDASIAVDNLSGAIEDGERRLGKSVAKAQIEIGLVGRLLLRGQLLGRIADYDRAAALAEDVVRLQPADAQSYLARSATRARLHQFADARSDLDKAQSLALRGFALDEQRAALAEATGDYAAALAYRKMVLELDPETPNLVAMAVLLGETAHAEEAEALFIRAQDEYRDVSPFAVATIYFQEGLMWQRVGSLARARELLVAAHERLPQYCAVTSHLASVLAVTGEREQAIAQVRTLVEHSDDPEYAGQLAQLLQSSGKRDEAKAWVERARHGYEVLLARHPEAFADHAARFYLGVGHDPARAWALARLNGGNRKTIDSYLLSIEAALAARDLAGGCAAADGLARLRDAGPFARLAIANAYRACGRSTQANAAPAW
jgi:tetratricopeptide (TPR) repeat protein